MVRFTVKRIQALSGKQARFPLDMLRYDRASPRDSMDVYNLQNILEYPDTCVIHSVTLIGERCTPDRWRSFGWSVYDQETVI